MKRKLITDPLYTLNKRCIIQFSEIKSSFDAIDANGDGRISKKELMKAAAMLGMNPTEKDANEMLRTADLDGKGPPIQLRIVSRRFPPYCFLSSILSHFLLYPRVAIPNLIIV